MEIFTLELSSMKESNCRVSFSQHPPHLSLAFCQNPLLSLGRGTEQQINKMQMAQITPRKGSGHDWGSTGVAGLKADNHPSHLFCVRSEVLARPLLLFAQGNYWFIYFYLHPFFMLEVLFTISPENIYIGPAIQRFRYFQDMLWENILRRVRKGC